MDIYIGCGPAIFLLRDFYDKKPFATWQWKLEPFGLNSAPDQFTVIDFNKASVDTKNASLVSAQKSGFYTREVLKTDAGIIHRLVRKSNSETALAFYEDADKNIILLEDDTHTNGQAAFEYLSRIVVHSMLDSSVLTLHGVLIEYNGKGIIICAPSETGKTTHARLWRDEKNALIINGDNACCYNKNGVWTGFGIPWSGTSGEQINRSVEIAAIVVLERADYNKATPLSEYDAFCKLQPLIHYPAWDMSKAERAIELCNSIIGDIPVFRLECMPNRDSVEILYNALEGVL